MTLSLLVLSLCYMFAMSIIYFKKKHINSEEIKIFTKLIIINIFGLLIEICCKFCCIYFTTKSGILLFLVKFYLLYIIWFSVFMAYYVYYLSNCKKLTELDIKKKKNFLIVMITISLLISVLSLILPVEFASLSSDYCTGAAVNIIYSYCIFLIFFCLFEMIINYKNLMFKKCLPLFILFVGFFVGALIQKYYPQITITTVVQSFVLFIMYFTIENPDMKMIEQLEIAKSQADKANRAKTDFLSSMSHEIRTPLNAIVGFSEYIEQSNTLEEAKENAVDIVNASKTLLEIVNGILDISKIEAGKIEIVNANYSTHELFDSTIKLARARLGDKNLDFRIHIAEDIPETLYGDKMNLKKIMINLLTNAIKYTDEGFFDFSVHCVINDNICRLIISVEDSGRGIKQQDIDKLFTKFTRMDEARNTTIEGTGLGLAITKQLIELMNGKIVVNSVYGKGSKFTVALDQMVSNEIVNEEIVEEKELDLTGHSILVVDDNNLNLKVASKILSSYNLNVELAESGEECLNLINNGKKYDLILMDDMMPVMRGEEVMNKLKEIPNFNTPIISLTANALSGMREKYMALGFDDFLSKPIEKTELYRILNKFINNQNIDNKKSNEVSDKLDLTNKKILIVDDNKLNIKVETKLLENYNPIVDSAISGKEAIEKLNIQKYDLILMDDMMPEMSGTETLHYLKDNNPSFDTPIIVVTANAIEGMKDKYLAEGFDAYISKPVNKEIFEETVKDVIEKTK